jgi:DNA-directed RNA polymerase specialized sigma24 family protein
MYNLALCTIRILRRTAKRQIRMGHATRTHKVSLEAASLEGRFGGRPPKLTPQQRSEIIRMASEGVGPADVARLFSVHPATISFAVAGGRQRGLKYAKQVTQFQK